MEICRCHFVPRDNATMRVVAHSFPFGTTFRFEPGTFCRGDNASVPCHYLVAEHKDESLELEKGQASVHRYIAILYFDGRYHLFSTTATMYGGHIHDEGGINYWLIDQESGATLRWWGSGINRLCLRIPHGQWGQIDAILNGWHPYHYAQLYWFHLREVLGLAPALTKTQWDEDDLQLVCDLITARLRETAEEGVRAASE